MTKNLSATDHTCRSTTQPFEKFCEVFCLLATLHEDKQLFPFVAFDERPEHVELVTQFTHRIILAQLVRGGVGGVLMHRHVPAKSRKNLILADFGVDKIVHPRKTYTGLVRLSLARSLTDLV